MVTARQLGMGVVRTMRAIDREAKRAERGRLALERAAQRQAMLEAAGDAAEQYSQFVASLTTAHRISFTRRDWFTPAAREILAEPLRQKTQEDAARAVEAAYRPGWIARTFGLEKGQRAKLAKLTQAGQQRDTQNHENRKAEVQEANAHVAFAKAVVATEKSAIERALTEHSELGTLPFSVEGVDLMFFEGGRLVAMVDGLDFEDMPEQSVSLLQSGKASVKPLARAKVMELHRENICASGLRVALECLQTLPLDTVEVVMHTDLLDAATGHIRSEPVLYLRVTAQAIEVVNLERTEATALVERLGAHFDWSKRDGFRPINLGPFDIEAPAAPSE